MLIYSYIIGKKRHYVGRETRATLREILHTGKDAALALIMPIIIIGGILSGIFTATESGAIACAYALILGLFVYRELKLSSLFDLFVDCAKSTGQVLLVVACASLFTWVITVAQVPQLVSAFLSATISNKYMLLLVINIVLLIAGTFIDTTSAIVIFTPLFLPLVQAMNIDLIHFGLVMAVNLTIGMYASAGCVSVCVWFYCGSLPQRSNERSASAVGRAADCIVDYYICAADSHNFARTGWVSRFYRSYCVCRKSKHIRAVCE